MSQIILGFKKNIAFFIPSGAAIQSFQLIWTERDEHSLSFVHLQSVSKKSIPLYTICKLVHF